MLDVDQMHQPFEASYGAPVQDSTQQVVSQQGFQQPHPTSLYPSSLPQHPQHLAAALAVVCQCRSQPTSRSRRFFRISNVRLIGSIILEHLVAGARRGPHGWHCGLSRNAGG